MSLPHQEKRGYIDVILAQLEIKDHLLYELIVPLVEPNVSKALQDHFSTVDNYRKCVPLDPSTAVDLAWQASWSIPQKKLSTFIENVIYKNVFEKDVKQNCANKQAAAEFFAMISVKDELESIKEALAPKKADGPSPEVVDPADSLVPDDDDVIYIPRDLEEMAQATIAKYQSQAYVLIDQSVQLLVEARDGKAMADLLREAWQRFDLPAQGPANICGSGRVHELTTTNIKQH